MEITFDPRKNAKNIRERGLSFSDASRFDWNSMMVEQDTRRDYLEDRFIGYGMIGERLHCVVFTPTDAGVRIISFRKANNREIRNYAQYHQDQKR